MLPDAYRVTIEDAESGLALWCAPIEELLRLGADILDEADRAHAMRFRQAADRDRITAARILLRHALTEDTSSVPPQAWHFSLGPNGKPLMGEGLPRLHFNLSHAAGAAAVAVSRRYAVGIDIEPITETEIIPDVLTSQEITRLEALKGPERWSEFMRIWTLKEACAKAMGLGLAYDFRHMEVAPGSANVAIADRPGSQIRTATTTVQCGGKPHALSVAWVDEPKA
jgi:4'-phosphopantetheinyl transferase